MFVTTKATVKLATGNTGHDQVIGIILFIFPNCSIISPVVPVYYCPDHPYNTISSDDLKFYVGFQKVTSEPIEYCDFVNPQVCSCRSPYQTQNNPDYIQIEIFKVNLHIDRNVVAPTACALSKTYLNLFIRILDMSILRD